MTKFAPIGIATIGLGACLTASLMMTACSQPAPAADPAKVIDEVKAAIHTQVDAYAAHDADKAASILSPDTIGMFHGEPNNVGAAAALTQIKGQMTDPGMKLAVSDEAVDVSKSGDLAVYRATYHFTYTDPATKQPATETGNWVAVFMRQPDGTMKMSRDMVLDTPALAPTSNEDNVSASGAKLLWRSGESKRSSAKPKPLAREKRRGAYLRT